MRSERDAADAHRRLLLGSAAVLGVVGLALGVSALTALAVATAALLLLAKRAAAGSLASLGLHRDLYPSAFEEDAVRVELSLDNTGRRAACLVEMGDAFGPALAERQALLEPGPLAGGRRRKLAYRIACSRSWGLYTVGPLSLAASDPLGLFRAEKRVPQVEPFAVFPRVYPVHGLARLGARPSLAPQDLTTSRPGQSLAYMGVREYRPGDEVRRIHWPATARRGAPAVKEFEVDLVPYFTLFVDLDRAHRAGTGLKCTLEYVVRAAASLLWSAVRRGDTVQMFGEGASSLFVPPGAGELHLTHCLFELIRVRQEGRPLLELLEQHRLQVPSGSTVALLSGTTALDAARLGPLLDAFRGSPGDGGPCSPWKRTRSSPSTVSPLRSRS